MTTAEMLVAKKISNTTDFQLTGQFTE